MSMKEQSKPAAVIVRTDKTSQPFSALRCLASLSVDARIEFSFCAEGDANGCGLRRVNSCLIAGGSLTIVAERTRVSSKGVFS